MLIRVSGYNTGAQEYLEEGNKSGREFTRDELDHRMIIDGQLSVTRAIYESIPDHGQDRYLTFTMSFKEDDVSENVLKAVTAEFKQFLMHAYKPEEFNFYAEAHLPKMKTVKDKKTGKLIDRKPHIHIVVPRINLLSGNEANPVDIYMNHEKHFEAFQEYLNQKYGLSSPRENVRADITDAASVLSRYKGDDFYGKNREFKQGLVKEVITRNITSRAAFYSMVAEYGETRIRNQGKDNEYLSVKVPGDAKNTNLKDTIFQDDFIVRRELKKPPLDPAVISARLQEWPQRAKEIKYVSKASSTFRKQYAQASPEKRIQLLAEREQKFYLTYGNQHDDTLAPPPRDHQRSPAEASIPRRIEVTVGVQDVSLRDVADHGQAGSTGGRDSSLLLPGNAHVHMGQPESGGDSGLRPSLPGGRGRRGRSTGGSERPASVPQETTGDGKQTSTGSSRRRSAKRLTAFPFPAHALNPHQVPTIADIEARGRRLFGPSKDPETESAAVSATTPRSRPHGASKAGRGSPKKTRKRFAADSRPPYARNPHRVAGVADIEARAKRLFDPLKGPVEQALVIKLPSIKPLLVNRQASTVAAYFTRQAEQNQLKPAQRRVLRRINKQFFDLRRSVFSDQRLTRQDKAQLVSVLTFERLKAREAIHNPQHNKEVVLMGSAEIRKLYVEDQEDPAFSISGPSGPGPDRAAPEGVRARVKRVLDNLSRQLDPQEKSDRERELNAKDLYTKKAKFSQNVHYLDKTTNKTLFVDTGKAIHMRRTGITEAGVAVALQLAKERFGSTLTINGTAEFKKLVIEAAAKNGIDVHFTDKAMNQGLAERRAELEIERDGQGIEQPTDTELKVAAAVSTAAGPNEGSAQRGADSSGTSGLVKLETEWRESVGLTEEDVRGSDSAMAMRGEYHANWLVGTGDSSTEAVAMIKSYMENDSYRENFKRAIEDIYTRPGTTPEDIDDLDILTGFVVELVNEIESRPTADAPEASAPKVTDRKIIEGTLVAHGAAPYQHNEKLRDKPLSYFVKLETDAGVREVWGVELADVMSGEPEPFQAGDRMRLIDLGTVPVTVPEIQEDGSVIQKTTHRRGWAGELETPVQDGPVTETVVVTPTMTVDPVEPEQDKGMSMD